jgi:hypothetical protein|tara:strand:+ start:4670 stop:5668 length:999 start_codon:yes stop_codon:yes gene_type:complete
MEILKKIGIRVLLLTFIILAAAFIYKRYFFSDFLKEEGHLLYMLNRSVNADYLFFSASSDYTFDTINDKDTGRVSFLTMNYCDKSIKSIAEGHHHAGVFKELIKHIPENTIEGIIVAMNLRSFCPKWLTDEKSENALQQYAAAYAPNFPLVTRLRLALKNYPIKTESELKETRAEYFKTWVLPYPFPKNNIENWCAIEKYGDWKNAKRQLADHYIKSYGFVIEKDHIRINDFDQIVELANTKNLRLIFHILPEDIEEAQILIGDSLTNLIAKNRNFMIQRYHQPQNNVWVIDNLEKVSHADFTDRDFPTEHYNQNGRTIIAKAIAQQLNAIK